MIKIAKIRYGKSELKKIANNIMQKKIKNIRKGRVIREKYKKSTANKRRKYGLQTKYVDLTGSNAYSRKSWRLLDSIDVVVRSNRNVVAIWTRGEASLIYEHHVRRYGSFLKRA